MRLLTYLTAAGKRHIGGLVKDRVIDIPHALERYQSLDGQNIKLSNRVLNLQDYFQLTDQEKQFLKEALLFTSENQSTDISSVTIAFDPDELILLPPILNPGKIICVAMNYPGSTEMIRSEYPVIFLKPSSTLCGSKSTVYLPQASQHVQFEAELAFYIGTECRNIDRSKAMKAISGYTIANDIGDSVLEKRTSQWVSGKMFNTFTPAGPFFVTPDEIPDPHDLEISTRLNGKLVQQANTGEMLFKIDEIIAYLSTLTTLYPGDMILTGSPKLFKGRTAPKIALKDGDQIEISISGLGILVNDVRKGE